MISPSPGGMTDTEAPPSASGPHYHHGLIGHALWNHYIYAEKRIKPTQFWHIFILKILRNCDLPSQNEIVPHKSVFNTWKLSKKWPFLLFYFYLNIFILGRPFTIFIFLLGAQQDKSKNMYPKIIVKTHLEKNNIYIHDQENIKL